MGCGHVKKGNCKACRVKALPKYQDGKGIPKKEDSPTMEEWTAEQVNASQPNRQAGMPDWFKYGELPARARGKNLGTYMFSDSKLGGDRDAYHQDNTKVDVKGIGANYRIPLTNRLTAYPGANLTNVNVDYMGNRVHSETKPGVNLGLKYNFQDGGWLDSYEDGGYTDDKKKGKKAKKAIDKAVATGDVFIEEKKTTSPVIEDFKKEETTPTVAPIVTPTVDYSTVELGTDSDKRSKEVQREYNDFHKYFKAGGPGIDVGQITLTDIAKQGNPNAEIGRNYASYQGKGLSKANYDMLTGPDASFYLNNYRDGGETKPWEQPLPTSASIGSEERKEVKVPEVVQYGDLEEKKYEAPNRLPTEAEYSETRLKQGLDEAARKAARMSGAIEYSVGPEDLIGLGLGKLALTGGKSLIKNAPKYLNPKYFKPTTGSMYRGLGKEGMEDALQYGAFRANPNPASRGQVGPFDMTKQFNTTYYSPKFNVADKYGRGYIAEVPSDVANFSRRYKSKDWSVHTSDEIPLGQGTIYEKDWWSGYKPVKAQSKNTAVPVATKRPTYLQELEANIKPELIPYQKTKAIPKTKEDLILDSYRATPSPDRELVKQGFDGNFITRPLTPLTKTELEAGKQWYRKIGDEKGLRDLIDKKGAQAPKPMKMNSGQTLDAPFFGRGNNPTESYSGMYAVEAKPNANSIKGWTSNAGGTSNYGSVPIGQDGSIMKNVPLEDLNVYRKKWFSNNYKKLDPNNLEAGMKYSGLQKGTEGAWKWGVRGAIAHDLYTDDDEDLNNKSYQYFKENIQGEKPTDKVYSEDFTGETDKKPIPSYKGKTGWLDEL